MNPDMSLICSSDNPRLGQVMSQVMEIKYKLGEMDDFCPKTPVFALKSFSQLLPKASA